MDKQIEHGTNMAKVTTNRTGSFFIFLGQTHRMSPMSPEFVFIEDLLGVPALGQQSHTHCRANRSRNLDCGKKKPRRLLKVRRCPLGKIPRRGDGSQKDVGVSLSSQKYGVKV